LRCREKLSLPHGLCNAVSESRNQVKLLRGCFLRPIIFFLYFINLCNFHFCPYLKVISKNRKDILEFCFQIWNSLFRNIYSGLLFLEFLFRISFSIFFSKLTSQIHSPVLESSFWKTVFSLSKSIFFLSAFCLLKKYN